NLRRERFAPLALAGSSARVFDIVWKFNCAKIGMRGCTKNKKILLFLGRSCTLIPTPRGAGRTM
ncbi:MAG: hypothetical protein ACPIOQ_81070, partial [Promethearchaeia archaeon]